MLDLKTIRDHRDEVVTNLGHQGVEPSLLEEVLQKDDQRKALILQTEECKARRNEATQEVAKKKKAGQDAEELILKTRQLGDKIKALDEELQKIQDSLHEKAAHLPNLHHESVPVGKNETDNEEVRLWGDLPSYSFEPKDHMALGEKLEILDFKRASKMSGARFTVLRGEGALLERALAQFMLEVATQENGYEEIAPPFIVQSETMFGTGQLPKFEEDLFKIRGREAYLIPTSEVPLTYLHAGEILSQKDATQRFTALTPCFRSEAGSYGKDTRGYIRQHQFNKVELVHYALPEESYQALETLTGHAEAVLQKLEIPYRVMNLATGDLGFNAAKTYDLEAWFPGQNEGKGCYREISSCSNCTDFQARRGNLRYRPNEPKAKPRFLHTLNGSGLAVGRTLIAVLENYQQEDGSIRIPNALLPYFHGKKSITGQND